MDRESRAALGRLRLQPQKPCQARKAEIGRSAKSFLRSPNGRGLIFAQRANFDAAMRDAGARSYIERKVGR
jgi:hypothetical protein